MLSGRDYSLVHADAQSGDEYHRYPLPGQPHLLLCRVSCEDLGIAYLVLAGGWMMTEYSTDRWNGWRARSVSDGVATRGEERDQDPRLMKLLVLGDDKRIQRFDDETRMSCDAMRLQRSQLQHLKLQLPR